MHSAIKILFFLVSATLISSCTNRSNAGIQTVQISDKSSTFRVIVDGIVKQDDVFALYYTTDESIDFGKNQPIWKTVKGHPGKQHIEFVLPKKVHPTQLRIDLGRNQQQADLYIKKISLAYKGKMLEIPGSLIFSYFRPDVKKTTIDASTGLVRGIIKNGKRQSPSLYPKETLNDKIEYLFE